MKKIETKQVKNGVQLTIKKEHPKAKDEIVVFQESGTETANVENFAEFLRYVADAYGPSTSRYSPARLYIYVRPGDKNEDFTAEDAEIIWPEEDDDFDIN